MKQYLDIPSLIKSNFYKKNKRLFWHVVHDEYKIISDEVHNLFKSFQLDELENEIFQITQEDIYNELTRYLTHILDFKIISKKNYEPIYSTESKIYINPIWQKMPIQNTFQLALNKQRNQYSKIRFFYSKLVEKIPKNYFKYIIASENILLKEFKANKKLKFLKILTNYHFSENYEKNSFSQNLSKKISNKIISIINEKYFNLSFDQKESINFILEINFTRAYNNIKDYTGFFKKTENLVLGTSNNYDGRLASFLANKNGSKIWKFNHGGERCFFNDQIYWSNLFYNTDVFVSYGQEWKKYTSRIIDNFRTNSISIGSKYHKKLYENYFYNDVKQTKKILYIPNSFVSEARQFANSKIIDPILYDWQKYLLETLQDLNYDVIYKNHPKGFFQSINNLHNFTKNKKNNNQLLASYFNSVNTVIVDYAGSGFVDALCAGKDIIYIDLKQRPFDSCNFNKFNSCIKIVPTYIKNKTYYLDTMKLIKALETPHKCLKSQKNLVYDFFING